MPPKKWEESSSEESSDESVDVQPVAVRRKFGDEEDSDDVADNWEEEEDSEVEREKAKKVAEAKAVADAEAAKNKKSKAQRIEEHREAARKRRAAEEEESSEDDEDEDEKRARLKKSEKEADLGHAHDLLGDVDLRNNRTAVNKSLVIEDKANPGQAVDLSSLSLFQPKTKTQFDQLSDALIPLLRQSSSRPHFPLWLPNFAKSVCQDMSSVDIKKVASALTALSNEKMKEEKAQEKGGKKSKAAKSKTTLSADRSMGRGNADTSVYDEDGLDDGDFM